MFPDLKSIERRRRTLAITQKQLAMATQVSQSLITKIERGVIIPNYEIACRIFAFLDAAERHEEKLAKDVMHKNVVVVHVSDTISKVISLTKKHRISQLPVLENHVLVGSISTKGLIDAPKSGKIKDYITDSFPTINLDMPVSAAKMLLKHHSAVLVMRNNSIEGIITAEDFL